MKDRQLELRHVQDKLPSARQQGVRELLFLIQGGKAPADTADIDALIVREFVTGQNIYVAEWTTFLSSCLVIFAEEGRRELLRLSSDELQKRKLEISPLLQWADLLAAI